MPHPSRWCCPGCGAELAAVDAGHLRVREGLRVEADRRGTILVTCPQCGQQRPWKTRRAA